MNDPTMDKLAAGVARFQQKFYREHRDLFQTLAQRQMPKVLFLTCSDSRLDPNLLTQSMPGDLFICRNIGNIVPPHGTNDGSVASVLEYAIDVLKVSHIIVCGHSECGAMKSLLDPNDDDQVPRTTEWLRYSEVALRIASDSADQRDTREQLRFTIKQNVIAQLTNLRTYPEVSAGLLSGTLALHGWFYDIATGTVEVVAENGRDFVPLLPTSADPRACAKSRKRRSSVMLPRIAFST